MISNGWKPLHRNRSNSSGSIAAGERLKLAMQAECYPLINFYSFVKRKGR